MMKSSLIRINLILILLVLFIPNLISAETKTFIKEYTYQASEDDSRNSSRTIALREVKRLLLEELGTYLESVTEVQNFQLTKDQITTLTAGIVKTEVADEKWDGHAYWLKSKIVADSGEVIKSIDILRKDREKTKELEELRKRSDDLLKENERLRKKLAAKGEKREKQKTAYDQTIKELSAIDWFEKGYAAAELGNHDDAVEAYSKAIEINPRYENTYVQRGLAYSKLGHHKQAIKDYDSAIKLNPKITAVVYIGRAAEYCLMDNYKQAIQDLNNSIEINPKLEMAYLLRGGIYNELGNYQQAIRDYNRAIELNQRFAMAYDARGSSHAKLGNHSQAIKDYNTAIEIDPKYADAYIDRGYTYHKLGKYNQAIEDYDNAIGLNPKANAYRTRGWSYFELGQYLSAITDFYEYIRINKNTERNDDPYIGLSLSYYQLDNIGEAKKYYQKAMEIEPLLEKGLEVVEKEKKYFYTQRHKTIAGQILALLKGKQIEVDISSDVDERYKGIKAIVLQNGDVIEGQIISMDPDIVKIRTKEGKILSYSFKKEVQRLITE